MWIVVININTQRATFSKKQKNKKKNGNSNEQCIYQNLKARHVLSTPSLQKRPCGWHDFISLWDYVHILRIGFIPK